MNSDEAQTEIPPFERLGGEPAVRSLVDRFYDREPVCGFFMGYARLQNRHGLGARRSP